MPRGSRLALDPKKLDFLSELLPADVSLNRAMKEDERKGYPSFDSILPHALQKDLSNLSNRLNRIEKDQIKLLYRAQLRVGRNYGLFFPYQT